MIRVFPRRTKWSPDDALAFVGDPPLFRPPDNMPVHVSVTFTDDMGNGLRLQAAWGQYYSTVKIGGPAFGDPGSQFEPGRYVKQGVTITSRGCPNRCAWCFVPKREGRIVELEIKPGHIIQDNNLLACSPGHIKRVFAMLRKVDRPAIFSGGLDTRYLRAEHVGLLQSIKLGEIWLAADDMAGLRRLEDAAPLLEPIPQRKKRVYVMVGYAGETVDQAQDRIKKIYQMGFEPFPQLYSDGTPRDRGAWSAFIKYWSRPAIYRSQEPKREA